MESQIGALILATDISRQNEYLSLFRSHLDKEDLCLTEENHRHLILQVIVWSLNRKVVQLFSNNCFAVYNNFWLMHIGLKMALCVI